MPLLPLKRNRALVNCAVHVHRIRWKTWSEGGVGEDVYVTNQFFNGDNFNDERSLRPQIVAVPYMNETLVGRPNCSGVNTAVMFRAPVYGTVEIAVDEERYNEGAQNFQELEDMIVGGQEGTFGSDIFEVEE